MSTFDSSVITVDFLNKLRFQTDPLADETVTSILSFHEEKKINEVMMTLFRNDSFHKGMFQSLGSEISTILDTYIERTGQLPEWADERMIKSGENLFSLYGPEIFMLLNVSSLPLCYSCSKGARVLYDTGRLLTHNSDIDPLARRLMETAQMVVNVLSEGGLTENGRGIVTLQKVRLIHASIRHYLKAGQYHGEKWDVSQFDEPINQEDLAGTLMSFAPVILSGLKKLDVPLTEKQMTDYMHCWKVVGHLMGIDLQLLPDTYAQGFDLATAILRHQSAPSESGKALTSSCIQFINSMIPGDLLSDVPGYLIHYFLEDYTSSSGVDLSKCIGVSDRSGLHNALILNLSKLAIGELSHLEEHTFIKKLSSHFNRKMLEGIIHYYNHGKDVQFFIPPSLQKNWKIANE